MTQPPTQAIYFGPPGSGKSHEADRVAKTLVGDAKKETHIIRTLFHPEFTYSDFVAKLVPMTVEEKIQYEVHPGPFIEALAQALVKSEQATVLIIDEINRGQTAAIFGDILQLLDRDADGVSKYPIRLSKLAFSALEQEKKRLNNETNTVSANAERTIKIPANLHLIGTMNTSDESVYYMDAAFKRRWDWRHVPWWGLGFCGEGIDLPRMKEFLNKYKIGDYAYGDLLHTLNDFISREVQMGGVDDKQIGWQFIDFSNYPTNAEAADLEFGVIKFNSDNTEVVLDKCEHHLKHDGAFNELKNVLNEKYPAQFDLLFSEIEKIQTEVNNTTNDEREAFFKCINKYFEKHRFPCSKQSYHKSSICIWALALKRLGCSSAIAEIKYIGDNGNDIVVNSIPNVLTEFLKCRTRCFYEVVKSKLSHHLWDNVFSRDRSPLEKMVNINKNNQENKVLVKTYSDFLQYWDLFLDNLMSPAEKNYEANRSGQPSPAQ